MDGSAKKRRIAGIEENTLAILDASDAKDIRDANDDRIFFLEAVRAASIFSENGTPPTHKMFQEIFQILRSGSSLELVMASYHLLYELEKRFPRVYISNSDKSTSREITVVQEAWKPFVLTLDIASNDRANTGKTGGGAFDPSGFYQLIQDLTGVAGGAKSLGLKCLRNMLLFQFLVSVLEGDFFPRNSIYRETTDWNLVRESLINMVLGSRKINYKGLMKDCLTIMCGVCQIQAKPSDTCDTGVAIALPQAGKCTSTAMQKFLIMVMELDTSRKQADMLGRTTRADAVRTPLMEIILDELTYNKAILSPFLEVFKDPEWKIQLVMQYFMKYISRTSVRTRRSDDSAEDATFVETLKYLSNSNAAKNIAKKIGAVIVQLLLAHGFKAFLSLASDGTPVGCIPDSNETVADGSLAEACKNLLSAFNCLRRTEKHMEMLPFAKEAIFAAATILSTRSL